MTLCGWRKGDTVGGGRVTLCGWREGDTVWVEGGRHCMGGGRVTLCGWREGDSVGGGREEVSSVWMGLLYSAGYSSTGRIHFCTGLCCHHKNKPQHFFV